jgi:glycosyltransferase involved in cell wall biosynthesis
VSRPRIIVVLGMHRGGTSAVARGVNAFGVSLGHNLMPPAVDNNEKGFWEDIEVSSLNDQVLAALGCNWHSLRQIDAAEFANPGLELWRRNARKLLEDKFGKGTQFAFKDPRTSRLLPFWQAVFAEMALEERYVIVLRNPLSVGESLNARGGMPAEQSALLWLGHMIPAVSHTAERKRVLIDYDRLLDAPDREVKRLGSLLGAERDKKLERELAEYKEEFLAAELRHTRFDADALAAAPGVPPLTVETYRLLLAAARDGAESRIEHAAWRRIEEAFAALGPLCSLLDREIRANVEARKTLVEREQLIAGMTLLAKEHRGPRERSLAEEAAQREAHIVSLNDRRAALDTTIVELTREVVRLNEVVTARDRSVTASNEALASRDARIAGLGATLADLKEKGEAADELAATLKQVLAQQNQDAAALRQALAAREAELGKASQTLEAEAARGQRLQEALDTTARNFHTEVEEHERLRRSSFTRASAALRAAWHFVEQRVLRRSFTFRMVPGRQLEPAGSRYAWRSHGPDPYFDLLPNTRTLPRGWVLIESSLQRSVAGQMLKLYFDPGGGMTESSAVRIPVPRSGTVLQVARLPKTVKALRWDPMESPGEFSQKPVVISELTGLERRIRMLIRVWRVMREYPRETLDNVGISWRHAWRDLGAAYVAACVLRGRDAGPEAKAATRPALTPAPQLAATGAAPLAASPARQGDAEVLIFVGVMEGESKRYRAHNVAEALNARGVRTRVLPFSELRRVADESMRPRTVVVFRAPYELSYGVEKFFQYARGLGIRVVFDVDDLVFEPEIINLVDGYHALNDHDKVQYVDGVHKYRKMLLEAGVATLPTEVLRREAERRGVEAHIIRNSVNREQLAIAAEILAGRLAARGPEVLIGYFSGSPTHQKDFARAESALLRILREHDNVHLLVVGFLDLGPAWKPFEARIRRERFQPYQQMLRTLARCDINIAPLEAGNPFCESKSELKYFEAAIVEVPTVATATEPFAAAIEDGRNGFLARNEAEWHRALSELVRSAERRREVGRAARAAALKDFGPAAIAEQAMRAYGLGALQERSASADGALRIDWVVPGLLVGGGGHRNILRAAHFLQQFGHDVGLHFTNVESDSKKLRELVHQHFYPFAGRIKVYDGEFDDGDVVFATHWSTVDAALRAKDRVREVMYFVQDFEPAFAPMGSEYVLAESTYRLGLYHITSGPWCERVLRAQFGADADHFRFPIDRGIYFPRPRTATQRRLLFFAKPEAEMPRRCFLLGSLALRILKQRRPDVEIVMFGSSSADKQGLDFPVTYLKMVPTLEGLAELYSNADLGLVFSTTNPSLVTYEMMSCGLPIVDLQRPGNEANYDDRTDIAYLADPRPEAMAEQLVALIDDAEQMKRRSAAGLEFVATFPTEEEMTRRIETLIRGRLRRSVQ